MLTALWSLVTLRMICWPARVLLGLLALAWACDVARMWSAR